MAIFFSFDVCGCDSIKLGSIKNLISLPRYFRPSQFKIPCQILSNTTDVTDPFEVDRLILLFIQFLEWFLETFKAIIFFCLNYFFVKNILTQDGYFNLMGNFYLLKPPIIKSFGFTFSISLYKLSDQLWYSKIANEVIIIEMYNPWNSHAATIVRSHSAILIRERTNAGKSGVSVRKSHSAPICAINYSGFPLQ